MAHEGVTQTIQAIYERDGQVKASTLVDEARPDDSPAHDAFEWRDDVAAEQFRLGQARRYIRVTPIIKDEKPDELVHVSVSAGSESREGYYKSLSDVAKSPNEYAIALEAAIQRLASAQRSLDQLRKVAAEQEETSEVARIAQMAEALSLMQSALRRTAH